MYNKEYLRGIDAILVMRCIYKEGKNPIIEDYRKWKIKTRTT